MTILDTILSMVLLQMKIISFPFQLMSGEPNIFPIVPSPDDPRDFVYEHIAQGRTRALTAPPKTLDLRQFLNYPRQQGNRGTCASFASACIKEYHERLDVDYRGYMSPDSVYFYRQNKPDAGMFLRDAMAILQTRGIAPENDMPYEPIREPASVPAVAVQHALNYKIASYAAITTIDGLKEALTLHGPCIIAFPVYDARPCFWKVDKDPTRKGGHAVAVVGYNDKGFIIRNSWGMTWNGDGCVIYPYSEWGSHWEVWSAVDEESLHIVPQETLVDKVKKALSSCRR